MVSNFSGEGAEESKSSLQPCLLMADEENSCVQTNMLEPLLYDVVGEIPEFIGRRIAGSSFAEWVLLNAKRTGGDDLREVLVNLLSKKIIELPILGTGYTFCILTSHPCDSSCRIVYFNQYEKTLIFCQPGDKEFTIKKWDYEIFPYRGGAAVAGKILVPLCGDSSVRVGVIEFEESTYRLDVVEMESGCGGDIDFCFEHSGELFSIYKAMCGTNFLYLKGFKIFKADLLSQKWVSVKNLREHAIFIGCYGTAHVQCASAKSGIEPNSIYFLEARDHYNYYIYNLEDGTVRLKPIFISMETELGSRTRGWIMMPSKASFCKLLKGDQESICPDSENENKTSGEVEEVWVQNSWLMVPPELLNLIQLHLFGRDHAVFRVVWHQVSIPDYYYVPSIPPLLSSTTLLEELCQSSSPLLMFQEDLTISDDSVPIFRFLDPVHKKLYRTGIPELRETDIQYSKDGWLLVSRRSDESIFFFNPLTQEKIELPRLPPSFPFPGAGSSLSFSSLPTCSNCLVVGIDGFANYYTLKHGEETWRRREMDVHGGPYMHCHCPVVLNGLHHFMLSRGEREVLVFNFQDGVEDQLPYRLTWSTKFEKIKCVYVDEFFLEIDGALAFVRLDPYGGYMSIFKWNDLKTEWELMEAGDDFGGKQMFLSRRGSFMWKIDDVDVGGLGNAIFLPMIDDAKQVVFFSLATHEYQTLYSDYSSEWELPYNVNS